MNSDLTFITNEKNNTLHLRFEKLIEDSKYFDCLVGYFYVSGFYKIYKSLEKSEKIRILIGISTNLDTASLISKAKLSSAQLKEQYENSISKEFEESENNEDIEAGTKKFIEWIKNNKLEVRAYPSQNIHAKLYIITFKDGHIDSGRVVTGSSNFTASGLSENLEFNVELKNSSDYKFARSKFDELWNDSIDVSEKCISTIQEKTWLKRITPYELYLKFLYEYFKSELIPSSLKPIKKRNGFIELEYQSQAVLNAKKILDEYGGVFISDVVGLGKTYITSMLVSQLDGGTLVIAPPSLIDRNNPNSWDNVLTDLGVSAYQTESIGKLDAILNRDLDRFNNIIIDEAHRFRTESNQTYEKLARICRRKKVILVTATPYNNTPKDLLSQIKLFQNARKSTIPNLPNLEAFFDAIEKRVKNINRKKEFEKYIETLRENSKEIREKLLKYIMVRRTRREVEKYYSEDLKKQNLQFPSVSKPETIFYKFNEEEGEIFSETIGLIAQKFSYARYMPLLYYKDGIGRNEQGQKNMGKFMKILLVKRLESSFHAFINSLNRMIRSYELFIDSFKQGKVLISKESSSKLFELMDNDDDEKIQELIENDKVQEYPSDNFEEKFETDLIKDLQILREIKKKWSYVERDPKLISLFEKISKDPLFRKNKLLIFTESKETAVYLSRNLAKNNYKVLCFTGDSHTSERNAVIQNFDAKAKTKKNDYQILVSTEVLAEGVNLHRSNIVINYDIPWNPTRLMQRAGRINRVDTKFKEIHIFNFFPTDEANEHIGLKEAAQGKINAFFSLLGGDAELLTEGEPIGSHELFDRLHSTEAITGEKEEFESELKYLQIIKSVKDKNPELYELIKKLPKKARSSQKHNTLKGGVLTFFKQDKIQKFFLADESEGPKELDFIEAAKLLEATPDSISEKIGKNYYRLLKGNSDAFVNATSEDFDDKILGINEKKLWKELKILRNYENLDSDHINYIKNLQSQIRNGAIPKHTLKGAVKSLKQVNEIERQNPLKIIGILQGSISNDFLISHSSEENPNTTKQTIVILSKYFIGNSNE